MSVDKKNGEVKTSITSIDDGSNDEIVQSISTVKQFALTDDVDEAMAAVINSERIEMTKEESRKLLFKIDLYLMPFFVMLYAVQYMDKITNSFASIMGLREDLNMKGQIYSWVSTAFYLGYLVAEIPVSLILQRYPIAKVTSAFIFLWGVSICVIPAVNLPGFMSLRVILGILESSITPTMVIITGQWYRKDEHYMRTTIWTAACSFGAILGYAIAYGLYLHGQNWSIASWKVVYIIVGLMNVLLSIAFYFHIPNNPTQAWFLTEREKLMVVERIRVNQQGFGNKHFKWDQFKECLTDYKVWIILVFILLAEIPNGGITNFSAILLNEDFGYTVTKSLQNSITINMIGFFGTILLAALHEYKLIKLRMLVTNIALTCALLGSSLLAFAENKNTRLGGFYVMHVSSIGFVCMLSLFQSNVAGHTKKVVGNALLLICYCVGNIIGPQTFRSEQAPNYQSAKGAIVGCYASCMLLAFVLLGVYMYENKKRDKKREELGDAYVKVENIEFADLTDKQNPEFRYSL